MIPSCHLLPPPPLPSSQDPTSQGRTSQGRTSQVLLVIIPLATEKLDKPLHDASPSTNMALSMRDAAPLDLRVLAPQTLEQGLRQRHARRDVQCRAYLGGRRWD